MGKVKYILKKIWRIIIRKRPSVWDIDEGEFFNSDDKHEIE